jgi:hypothetical protein
VRLIELAQQVGARARQAAERGHPTFAVPELSDVATWIAGTSPHADIRAAAAAWESTGASYHALVRLAARAAITLDARWPPSPSHYRAKAEGELEPMLALWPGVLLLPTHAPLSPWDLMELRAFPVHPLGLTDRLAWTDGKLATPSEFFFHDLDHARFKVRRDLEIEGVAIPDPYRGGTTLDHATGRHRLIMGQAAHDLLARLWDRAPARHTTARALNDRASRLAPGPLRSAVELLLFEMLHEKSCPLERPVMARELDGDAHLAKLRWKAAVGFFPGGTAPAVVDALVDARALLRAWLT